MRVTEGGAVSLTTVTFTTLVVALPARSRAIAVSVWLPLAAAVVVHICSNGAAVISGPSGLPSSRNLTPATATLSEADAAIRTLPNSEPPPVGALMETDGDMVSAATPTASGRLRRPLPMPAAAIGCALLSKSAALL